MSSADDTVAVYTDWFTGGLRAYVAAASETSRYLARQLARGASPAEYANDALRWHQAWAQRSAPDWASPNTVRYQSSIVRLRDFSAADGTDIIPTLVLPPQAGHHSCIVDFSPGQSQIQAIRDAGLTRAYVLEWLAATQASKHTTIEDYVAELDRVVDLLGGRVNLIGDCQGGWLAAIYAALRPSVTATLTLAGAPIDFHAAPNCSLARNVRALAPGGKMDFFEGLVARSGGLYPGQCQYDGFVALAPATEVKRQSGLLNILDDEAALARYREFENWFRYTQDLPGDFYLWLVRELFIANKLIAGELVLGGATVDLARISCPTFMLAGATDHITPPTQLFALADHISTPARDQLVLTAPGGHLGLFMGHAALHDYWPTLLAEVARRS